jgi:hypothetical protein
VGYPQTPLSEKADESDMDVPGRMIKKTCDQKDLRSKQGLRSKAEAESDNIPWRELALKIMTAFIWAS